MIVTIVPPLKLPLPGEMDDTDPVAIISFESDEPAFLLRRLEGLGNEA